jgi:hypothetical protein
VRIMRVTGGLDGKAGRQRVTELGLAGSGVVMSHLAFVFVAHDCSSVQAHCWRLDD